MVQTSTNRVIRIASTTYAEPVSQEQASLPVLVTPSPLVSFSPATLRPIPHIHFSSSQIDGGRGARRARRRRGQASIRFGGWRGVDEFGAAMSAVSRSVLSDDKQLN
jgi:hypothetical protein